MRPGRGKKLSEKKQCQVIKPPNTLLAKFSKTGGPSKAEMMADAEAALHEYEDTYETVVRADLQKINDAISRATKTPTSAPEALKEIFGVSHDIKGQAASFNYPLLTAIAQSLCRFINSSEAAALKKFDVVGAHAKAMGTVVKHSMRSDGLVKGRKLLKVLDAAVEQALARK